MEGLGCRILGGFRIRVEAPEFQVWGPGLGDQTLAFRGCRAALKIRVVEGSNRNGGDQRPAYAFVVSAAGSSFWKSWKP